MSTNTRKAAPAPGSDKKAGAISHSNCHDTRDGGAVDFSKTVLAPLILEKTAPAPAPPLIKTPGSGGSGSGFISTTPKYLNL